MRIGFFGGSFDPPHAGHLAVAEAALQNFALDLVHMAPVALQPLKGNHSHAGYADRLRMVEALCKAIPGLAASDLDAPREDGEPNYTVDTLVRLRAEFPAATLFSIAGLDAFSTIRQWHRPDELLEIAEWIVVSRPGSSFEQLERIGLSPPQRARVHTLTTVEVPVSATDIRARLAAGDPCSGIVAEPVLDYIHEHHLYDT